MQLECTLSCYRTLPPVPVPSRTTPFHALILFKMHFNIHLSMPRSSSGLFLPGSPSKVCMQLCCPPYMPHVGRIARYSDWLWAGWSGDRIPVGQDFPPIHTGPGTHLTSCTVGTGSFPGLKSGQGMMLTPHPLLVPQLWKGRAVPLQPVWAVRLGACTRVHFTFYLPYTPHAQPIPFSTISTPE